MKLKLVMIFTLIMIQGCAALYKNPTGVPTTKIVGSFNSYKEYKLFFKEQRQKTRITERFTEPLVLVSRIDGIEVNESTIPALLTEGTHHVNFRLHDTEEYVDFYFSIDVKLDQVYESKFVTINSNQGIKVQMWIEDRKTGEIITAKKKGIMVPFQRIAVPPVY